MSVYGLDDILIHSVNGSGYNEKYGLLGSNKATEEQVKLFPRDCQGLVEAIQKRLAGGDRQACGGDGLRRRRL